MELDENDKQKVPEGTVVIRDDGARIAGFYHGDDPQFSDDNTVWCVNCADEAPEASSSYPIKPIILQDYVEDYGDPTEPLEDSGAGQKKVKNDLDGISCSVCCGELPTE